VERLRSADLRAAIEFVEDAWAAAGERPFTAATLEALDRLIPSDVLGYTDADHVERRIVEYVGNDGDGGAEIFWDIVGEHPLCRYQLAYNDYSARRLSDVISQRRLVRTRVYGEWFRPFGLAAELEIGLGSSRAHTYCVCLDRGKGDYSLRDRAVLELVRPHLTRIREHAELRRAAGATHADEAHGLTARETEILELVECGLTNAGIAERLWISPGTVKKHLDNIYAKLGVRSRTAAARALKTPR
jgi:DNA-binding CsgD family transcriptional regulator